jgi:carbamoyltransferase
MSKNDAVLGVSLGFNSSACLFSNDNGLLFAVSEERLNGEKNTKAFPVLSLIQCLEYAKKYDYDVSCCAYSFYQDLTNKMFFKYARMAEEKEAYLGLLNARNDHLSPTDLFMDIINGTLFQLGMEPLERVWRVEHHMAHAYSAMAFFGVPSDNYCMITSDGFGDGLSATITDGKTNLRLSEVPLSGSVALVYQFVTGALGFKEHQHEGKITGLAAMGKPIHKDVFRKLFKDSFVAGNDVGNSLLFDKLGTFARGAQYTEEEIIEIENSVIQDFDVFMSMKKAVYALANFLMIDQKAKREDIASSVQQFAEETTLEWIYMNVKKLNYDVAYLAGGLFANVKINQRICESKLFKQVFVCPAMGDEGTCVGAAVFASTVLFKQKFEAKDGRQFLTLTNNDFFDAPHLKVQDWRMLNRVRCGTNKAKGEDYISVLKMLSKQEAKLNFDYSVQDYSAKTGDYTPTKLALKIADDLANKKIVCMFNGRMEFGPRALCHRSILYDCSDNGVNSWLNEQLSRTEFMPFAPVCLERYAKDLFEDIDAGLMTSQFMTVTFNCTEEFKRDYPAGCHVDGTARPQIILERDETNDRMNRILKKYFELTGKKAIINTSFNLHNNPIIEDPAVAVESWARSKTDVLVIGNCRVERLKR